VQWAARMKLNEEFHGIAVEVQILLHDAMGAAMGR
jgi:hypothetical protein